MVRRYVVILAGGKGERFWPQSRRRRPKQFLPIVGDRPMLRQTLERVLPVLPAAHVLVLTNAEQAAAVRRICPELPRRNVVAEPVGRDSGPAVGLAALLVAARDPAAVFASLHSDAAIHDVRAFQRDLRAAFAVAEAAPVIVLIGVPPTEPSTAYGYIQRAEPWRTVKGRVIFRSRRFLAGDLEKLGHDIHDLLHVRSFLDHNRPYVPPANYVKGDRTARSTGAFAHLGEEISADELEENLVRHLRRWAPYVGRFGLLLLELHTLPPEVAASNLDKTPAVAYDGTHGFSDQYLVELPLFLDCAREAGLVADSRFQAAFPPSELATISVNYFTAP